MKKTIKSLLASLLCFAIFICITGCKAEENEKTDVTDSVATSNEEKLTGVWADATYTEDAELGSGNKTIEVEVIAENKSITFTLKTDKNNLGDALMEQNLLEGEESDYGLFIQKVIGIRADYDLDGAYWAISKDGEYLMTGADVTEISDGEHYELTYTEG